jgi:hypothetical protein
MSTGGGETTSERLRRAISDNNVVELRAILLEDPRRVFSRFAPQNMTLLHLACSSGSSTSIEIIKNLIELHPAILSIRDSAGYAPLHYAVAGSPLFVLEHLITLEPTAVRALTYSRVTVLHSACFGRRGADVLAYLVDKWPVSCLVLWDGDERKTPYQVALERQQNKDILAINYMRHVTKEVACALMECTVQMEGKDETEKSKAVLKHLKETTASALSTNSQTMSNSMMRQALLNNDDIQTSLTEDKKFQERVNNIFRANQAKKQVNSVSELDCVTLQATGEAMAENRPMQETLRASVVSQRDESLGNTKLVEPAPTELAWNQTFILPQVAKHTPRDASPNFLIMENRQVKKQLGRQTGKLAAEQKQFALERAKTDEALKQASILTEKGNVQMDAALHQLSQFALERAKTDEALKQASILTEKGNVQMDAALHQLSLGIAQRDGLFKLCDTRAAQNRQLWEQLTAERKTLASELVEKDEALKQVASQKEQLNAEQAENEALKQVLDFGGDAGPAQLDAVLEQLSSEREHVDAMSILCDTRTRENCQLKEELVVQQDNAAMEQAQKKTALQQISLERAQKDEAVRQLLTVQSQKDEAVEQLVMLRSERSTFSRRVDSLATENHQLKELLVVSQEDAATERAKKNEAIKQLSLERVQKDEAVKQLSVEQAQRGEAVKQVTLLANTVSNKQKDCYILTARNNLLKKQIVDEHKKVTLERSQKEAALKQLSDVRSEKKQLVNEPNLTVQAASYQGVCKNSDALLAMQNRQAKQDDEAETKTVGTDRRKRYKNESRESDEDYLQVDTLVSVLWDDGF